MTSVTSRHDVVTATAATAEQGAGSAQAIEYIEGELLNIDSALPRVALFSIARIWFAKNDS